MMYVVHALQVWSVMGVLGCTACGAETPAQPVMEVPIETAPPDPPISGEISNGVELPRQYVDTKMPAESERVLRVAAGGDLQAALHEAKPGDVVELEAGAVYSGSFTLPAKQGDGWIVIRSSAYARLPEGRRVTPADAPLMAMLVGGESNRRVLQTAEGAHHYRLIGLEIALAPAKLPGVVTTIIEFGESGQTLETMPKHLILDRSYVHGTPTQSLTRCVTLNSAWSAVIESYLDECHARGFDSQAIGGWSGTGPFKIANNFLAGAGENIMFGGAAVGREGMPPSDIEIRGNHIFKPLAWEKSPWVIKNLLELKIAERVLIEGNVLENMWADAQVGFAVNIKSENRNTSTYPNLATRDVTFRNNRIVNSRFGFTVIGAASTKEKTGEGRTERVLIENNLLDVNDRAFQVGGVDNLVIQGNTASGRVSLEGIIEGFEFRGNLIKGGLKGSGVPEGVGTLRARAPGGIFTGNALVGVRASVYPEGNEFPASLEEYRGAAGVNAARLGESTAKAVNGQ